MKIVNSKSFSRELGVLMFKAVYNDGDEELIDTIKAMINCIDEFDEDTSFGIEAEAVNCALTKEQIELYKEVICDTFEIELK